MVPALFLVLIVLMCGGIAVLADDLGRRLGKKRLHFKGIRPKRVAQIGTFLAGIIVSLVTIAIVSAASKPVRDWIRKGSQAILEAQELQAKNHDLDTENKRLASMRETLIRQNGVSNNQLRHKTAQLGGLNKEISTLKPKLAALNAQVSELRPRLAEASQRVRAAKAKIDQLNAEQLRTKGRLASLQGDLAKARGQLAQVNANLRTARLDTKTVSTDNALLAQKNLQLNAKQRELTTQIADLEEQRAQTEQQLTDAKNALDSAKTELSQTQRTLSAAQMELESTRQDLAQARVDSEFFKAISQVPRYQPMIYHMGEEVARLPVEGPNSIQSAKLALSTLLRSARVNAGKFGAKPNEPYPEAGIFEHVDSRTKRKIPPEEIENEIATKIAAARDPVVLVAYSTLNAFKGEPVSLEVDVLPNPVVFQRGQVVAELDVDGRKEPTSIYRQINDLAGRVRERMRRTPLAAPNPADPWLGAVSPDEVYLLMSRVHTAERPVRVRAIAEANTRAADPLKLTFLVR